MNLASYIDHTLLKPEAQASDIEQLCQEAKTHHFKSVCIQPTFVKLAHDLLQDSPVLVCTVIGFPLGANTTSVKVFETQEAILRGAQEIDMVINIGWVKDQAWEEIREEIRAIKDVCNDEAILKVIIETCLLTDEEKVKVCQLAKEAGADFVKTSTGFSTGGARVEDIKLMRDTVGENVGVKASGGVRTREDALAMIEAGANRLGASQGVAIVKEG